jgi:hypothetical protein
MLQAPTAAPRRREAGATMSSTAPAKAVTVLLCDQTYCIEEYNAADLGGAAAGDTPHGGGGGGEREWDCQNDCAIYWTSEDGYWYFCAWLGEDECDPWEDDCCCDEYGYDCEWSQFWGGECPHPGGGGGGGGGSAYAITCESSVLRGDDITCVLSPSQPMDSVHWEFTGGGFYVDTTITNAQWSGTAAIGGLVSATVYVGTTGTSALADSYSVINRSWSIPASGDTVGLGGYGAEPIWPDTTGFEYAGNISLANPSNVSYAPDGVGGHGAATVTSGPNEGLKYVTDVAYTLHRTYWLNDWFKSGHSSNTLRHPTTGTYYNHYNAENVIFGGNGQTILDHSKLHEMTGGNSHQMKMEASVNSGCGNVAKYVERVVAFPGGANPYFDYKFAEAQNAGGAWLFYEASHKYVYGHVASFAVFRWMATDSAYRQFKTDPAGSELQPPVTCIQ